MRLTITGTVQGVGYRAWFEREARGRDLDGWVRNRRDGSVEALVAGDPAAVESMIAAAGGGPRAARVTHVDVAAATAPDSGFDVLPMA